MNWLQRLFDNEWNLRLLGLAVSGMLAFAIFVFNQPKSAIDSSRHIPVGVNSNLYADYNVDEDATMIKRVEYRLLRDALQDRLPSAAVDTAYRDIIKQLESPVPTVTPKPMQQLAKPSNAAPTREQNGEDGQSRPRFTQTQNQTAVLSPTQPTASATETATASSTESVTPTETSSASPTTRPSLTATPTPPPTVEPTETSAPSNTPAPTLEPTGDEWADEVDLKPTKTPKPTKMPKPSKTPKPLDEIKEQ